MNEDSSKSCADVRGDSASCGAKSEDASARAARPIIEPVVGDDGKVVITPEMRELANKLAPPKVDPYLNGRNLGFYCEQCG